MDTNKLYIILSVIVITLLLIVLTQIKLKLEDAKRELKHQILMKNKYKEVIEKKKQELHFYAIAFITLKSLFHTRPKSLINGSIKKSFQLKENGETINTIKINLPDGKVKNERKKDKLYFEYSDTKNLISYEDLKLACAFESPEEFNKYYEEFARNLNDMNSSKRVKTRKHGINEDLV